jgi:hypothetical protein
MQLKLNNLIHHLNLSNIRAEILDSKLPEQNKNFDALLKGTKKVAWEVLKLVDNFLGKHKAPTYRTHLDTLRGTFRNMGSNISLKLHFHHSHLDSSSKQLQRGQFSIFM